MAITLASKESWQPLVRNQNCSTPQTRWRRVCVWFAGLFILAVISAAYFRHHLAPVRLMELDCGRSPEIARSKGCILEPMIYGWVPKPCYFEELSSQFDAFHDRLWYSDINMTQPLSVAQVEAGEIFYIYTPMYHDQHCVFLWYKFMYALHHGLERLDNKTTNVHHSHHCGLSILSNPENGTGMNKVGLGYYGCKFISPR